MKIAISLLLIVVMFSSCTRTPVHEFPWKPYSKQAVDEAAAQKRPVVIDFYAEWCPNCHELDRFVFSRPEIQARLSQVTALRVDLTNQDDAKAQEIAEQYGVQGIPTVVFLDRRGKEIENARVIGFVTPEEFMQSLASFNLLK